MHRFSNTSIFGLLELKHVKNGFKKLNKDIKYTIDVKKEYINKKY